MRLQIGDEYRDPSPTQAHGSAPDRPAYRVTGVVRETPWFGLYEGKKLFTNYHFGRRALEEASEPEGLDVFLKTVQYAALDDREHIKEMRDQAFFELRRVLGRGRQTRRAEDSTGRVLGQPLSNLLPEPIDFLQVPNDRDVFALANIRQLTRYEPILVFERVHGVALDAWLSQETPSLLRRLSVLADLLDFLAVLHAEGLLLNGLEPEVVWIDALDRLHYLGSDRIIEVSRQAKQRKLYPPERYPLGYAPAELFDPEQAVSGASDLYSWAALAYFLIVGDSPAAIALRQGTRFAHFNDAHLVRLQHELQTLPAAALPRVQQRFRIAGARFAAAWPDNFVGVLRECLLPQQAERPAGREVLNALWATSRPRPVPAALAVHLGKRVELLLAARELEPGLEMVIRRGTGFVPRLPQEGVLVAEGALAVHALDRKPLPRQTNRTPGTQPHYAVFTRIQSEGGAVYSPPTLASLLDLAHPEELLAFAEEAASRETEGGSLEGRPVLPDAVALLEELPDAAPVARVWLGSSRPLVRRWALTLLEGQLRTSVSREPARELLLDRCRTDDRADLRQAALRALFQGERRPAPTEMVGVALTLSKGDIDAAVRQVRGWTAIGLEPDALEAAVAALEQERTSPCPECQAPVPARELAKHLRTQHGYVGVDGALLPYGEALRTLWKQLFVEHRASAVERLAELFTERHGDRAVAAFANALQAQVIQHAAALGPPGTDAEPGPNWRQVGHCLTTDEFTFPACTSLLTNSDFRVRRLMREAVLPYMARFMARIADEVNVRATVDRLCAMEDLATRLAVCQRLLAEGAPAAAVRAVLQELEQDLEAPCPHCGGLVRRRDESDHLRLQHGIYEVDGIRLPWKEALAVLAKAMLTDASGKEAAGAFVRVTTEQQGAANVAAELVKAVVNEARQRGAVPPLGAVAELPQASDVVKRLLEGHLELALPLFIKLGKQASLSLMERMTPLLGKPTLGEEERRRALEVILTNGNAEKGTRERALNHFLHDVDPLAALRLLDELEHAVGRSPMVEARRQQVQATELSCPQCPTRLPLTQVEQHAWDSHRLVLEAGTWQKAWDVIEARLRTYQRNADDPSITRAVELARRDDPETGPQRLSRLARRLGVRHPLLPRVSWYGGLTRRQRQVLAGVLGALLAVLTLVWLWRR